METLGFAFNRWHLELVKLTPGVNFIIAKRRHLKSQIMVFRRQKYCLTFMKFHITLLEFKTPKCGIYLLKLAFWIPTLAFNFYEMDHRSVKSNLENCLENQKIFFFRNATMPSPNSKLRTVWSMQYTWRDSWSPRKTERNK